MPETNCHPTSHSSACFSMRVWNSQVGPVFTDQTMRSDSLLVLFAAEIQAGFHWADVMGHQIGVFPGISPAWPHLHQMYFDYCFLQEPTPLTCLWIFWFIKVILFLRQWIDCNWTVLVVLDCHHFSSYFKTFLGMSSSNPLPEAKVLQWTLDSSSVQLHVAGLCQQWWDDESMPLIGSPIPQNWIQIEHIWNLMYVPTKQSNGWESLTLILMCTVPNAW